MFDVFGIGPTSRQLPYVGPSWPYLGLSWALLGFSWGHLGAILGVSRAYLGSSWGDLVGPGALKSIVSPLVFERILVWGLSWAFLWPSWAILGPSWGHLGLSLGHLDLPNKASQPHVFWEALGGPVGRL